MNILIYIIKTVLISGLLLGYYWLFLRNRFFHGFNRFFLLAIPVLGLVLPILHLSIPIFWNPGAAGSPIRLLGVGGGTLEEAVTVYAGRKGSGQLSWQSGIGIFSGLVSGVLLLRFYRNLRFLYRLPAGKQKLQLPEATICFVSERGTPFSFFKTIFWGKETDLNSPAGRQILRHEIFHVRNNHSFDIISLEIFTIIAWFNPFYPLIRRELQIIHEYGADAWAAEDSDKFEYAGLLLMNMAGSPRSLTHPFFKNQIKRRITMITRNNKNKRALLGRFMILPLLAILIGLFSFRIQNHFHLSRSKSIRVVIDAGHGGSFNGAQYNGVLEKNINLTIAKKIQALSGEYNVEVILSRESDVTPGSNELRESLEYITALPKNKNADLFISIHVNSTESGQEGKVQTSRSGFQIYIPLNASKVYEGSLKFGSVMTEVIKPDYTIEPELKQTQGNGGNIFILRNATVPALLIECGYMDNPTDLKYLLDEMNQEKIARDILEGIRKYNLQNTVYSAALLSGTASSFPSGNIATSGPENSGMKMESTPVDNAGDSSAPLRNVEVDAEYPGGAAGWLAYLTKNLKYPDEAVNKEVQGSVIVEFVINEDGSLTDIHAISGPRQLRAESIRVVTESGKWVPGRNHGVIVASYHKQPINYKLAVK